MTFSSRHNLAKFIVILIFSLFTFFWILINYVTGYSVYRDLFSDIYGISAGVGGIVGLVVAQKWGGLRSHFGRTVFLFSLGLILQFFGQLVYTYYYLFLHIPAPYPSLGDLGFFGSIPAYILAIYYLAKSLNIHPIKAPISEKILSLVMPLGLLLGSYYMFLSDYEFGTDLLTTFLDFGYPFGQAIYISMALLVWMMSNKALGGVMKNKILLIFVALITQYIADFSFLYMLSNETWVAGGLNDYIYLVSYFLMSLSLIKLNEVVYGLRSS